MGAQDDPERASVARQTLIRTARDEDADDMAALLNEIISAGGTTAHTRHFDRARLLRTFTSAPRAISCHVAVDGGTVLGFQALEWSDPDWPGEDRLPADWAIISTYVRRPVTAGAWARRCSHEPAPRPGGRRTLHRHDDPARELRRPGVLRPPRLRRLP